MREQGGERSWSRSSRREGREAIPLNPLITLEERETRFNGKPINRQPRGEQHPPPRKKTTPETKSEKRNKGREEQIKRRGHAWTHEELSAEAESLAFLEACHKISKVSFTK